MTNQNPEEHTHSDQMHQFSVRHKLNEGTTSRVYLVEEEETRRQFAAKIFRDSFCEGPEGQNMINNEIEVLQKTRHCRYVCTLYGTLQDPVVGLVLELGGRDLFDELREMGRFEIDEVKEIISQLIDALEEIHQLGIVFRDLRLENVVRGSDGGVRLVDFGLSKVFESCFDYSVECCGNLMYLSPEEITGNGYRFEPDWWALGIVMYELLVGVTPFQDRGDSIAVCTAICCEEIEFPDWINGGAKDLISRLADKRASRRLKDPEIIRCHPFFM
eukprot:TRINITY_DN2618_c0_g1_i1.p1 TRINITY_DN2618_c0_g1~~TRINITY_DN2618_c0_g1_i1.p1  ORF type:complete len:273 (+),score=39.11 TRINITY_DN2618_c0_g1_i1:47-865(+)